MASLLIAFNNPSCAATYVNSLTLAGTLLSSSIATWDNDTKPSSVSNFIVFTSAHPSNTLVAANVTDLIFYPVEMSGSPQSIVSGNVYNYVANFANGQSVSGSLIAQ